MRTFSDGRLARTIAYLLTAAFLWPLGLTGIAAAPASAQVVTRAAGAQSVAVVPFENRTRIRPETLGDEAAAAVSAELRDRLLLDVLPRQDVALQMRDLGIVPPVSDVEMVRLASELDISLVVTGQVRGISLREERDGRYAEVALSVRLFDRIARANVNGAVVTARGPGALDASEDVLIEKALRQAAFQAIEQMKARPTVTAMVLWSRGDTVFLNIGTRGGIRPGMRLVAIRGGERIGLVRVTEADAIGSYASSVEGVPLRTGDSLRAIYEEPIGIAAERVGVAQEKRQRFETIAYAAAIFLGLGNYASRARRIDEGDTVLPDFTAANLANGAQLGISGYIPSFHITRDRIPRPAAIVRWGSYQSTERARLKAIEIVRGGYGEVVDVWVTERQPGTLLIDGPEFPGLQTVQFAISEVDGGLSEYVIEFTPWDPDEYDFDLQTWSNPTFWEFYTDNLADAMIEITNTSYYRGWFPSIPPGDDYGGMEPDGLHIYQARPLIIQQSREGTWFLRVDTEFTSRPNFVVGVVPAGVYEVWHRFVGLSLNVYRTYEIRLNPEIVGNLATFRFYYPWGADQIFLEIARAPNFGFEPATTLSIEVPAAPPAPSPFPYTNSHYVWPRVGQPGVDLAQVPGRGDLFVWRVKARSLWDSHPARSWPVDDPALRGFVFSPSAAFAVDAAFSHAARLEEQQRALSAARTVRARSPRRAPADRILRGDR